VINRGNVECTLVITTAFATLLVLIEHNKMKHMQSEQAGHASVLMSGQHTGTFKILL
jgi:hypothetical protein